MSEQETETKNRFEKKEDGWVKDLELGIEWGPSSEKIMDFKAAEEYCQNAGGRLPTLKELHSLVDYTKSQPAIDTAFFADTKIDDWYWTNTPGAGSPGYAWVVLFRYGNVASCSKGVNDYVRPVRVSQ